MKRSHLPKKIAVMTISLATALPLTTQAAGLGELLTGLSRVIKREAGTAASQEAKAAERAGAHAVAETAIEAGGKSAANTLDTATETMGASLSKIALREQIGDQLAKNTDHMFADLNLEVLKTKPAPTIGRDIEVENLVTGLMDSSLDGVLLSGQNGVGRTNLTHELVRRIHLGEVPEKFEHARVIEVNVDHESFREANLLKLDLAKVRDAVGNGKEPLIFVLDRLEKGILNDNAGSVMKYVDALKRMFPGREVKVIGKTETSFVSELEKSAPDVAARFSRQTVEQIEDDVILFEILRANKVAIEKEFGVVIPDEHLEDVIRWSKQYAKLEGMPGAAIQVLRGAASRKAARISSPTKEIVNELTARAGKLSRDLTRAKSLKGAYARDRARQIPQELAAITESLKEAKASLAKQTQLREKLAALNTNLDAAKAKNDQRALAAIATEVREIKTALTVLNREDFALQIARTNRIKPEIVLAKRGVTTAEEVAGLFERRLFGQPRATELGATIFGKVRRARTKDKGPRHAMIATGPTGVGKTEWVYTLGEATDREVIRINMSEYKSKESISRLIGSDPGFIGHESGGFLVNEIRRNPRAILLLDEIEKAHPEVFDLLLQVLDEAALRDGRGVKADFKDVLVVMTTNYVKDDISELAAREAITLREVEIEAGKTVRSGFLRPEIMGRIDDVIPFGKLNEEAKIKVLEKRLRIYNEKAMEPNFSELTLTPEAKSALVRESTAIEDSGRRVEKHFDEAIEKRLNSILDTNGLYKDKNGNTLHANFGDGDRVIVDYNEELGFVIRAQE